MRAPHLIVLPLAVVLLAACTGDPEGDAVAEPSASAITSTQSDPSRTTAPGASVTPTAGADAGDSGAAGADDGDTDDSADDSSVDGGDSSGNSQAHGADPYCEPALAGAQAMGELLDATDRKSAETGVPDDGGSVAAMNEAGADMLTAASDVDARWTEAAQLVDDPAAPAQSSPTAAEATAAFDDLSTYLSVWVEPEATIAAESSSIAEYDAATAALLQDSGVTTAAVAGGEGLSVVLSYTLDRCGELPEL